MALIICRGGTFLLEQPASSLMSRFHRFEWLTRQTRVPCPNQFGFDIHVFLPIEAKTMF